MRYENIKQAEFLSRPNRFIANIELDGKPQVCHVKNTGRCKELLTDRAKIYVQHFPNTTRKTEYDLIAVEKNGLLINMDSQAPNKVFHEWVNNGGFIDGITYIKPECKYRNSRFDFYMETPSRKIFAEIKGVTLEENGTAMFPDAPTERGIKHINELIECKNEGYDAYIFFIIQMENCKCFTPNRKTHPEFADALERAGRNGVEIVALNCKVTPNELKIFENVEIV